MVYELNKFFWDVWVAKLPWKKNVLSEDELVTHVRWKICIKVMGKLDKFLLPSLNLFVNNIIVGTKLLFPCPMFLKVYYILLRMKCFAFLEMGKMCWTSYVRCGTWGFENSWFVTIFHLLWKGKSMLEYENMKGLLQFIQMRNYPHKHSCDNINWSTIEITHDIVNATIAKVVKGTFTV